MKKIMCLVLTGIMVMSLAACGGTTKTTESAAADASSIAESAISEVSNAAESALSEASNVAESAVSEASSAAESAVDKAITDAGVGATGTLVMATNAEFPPYEYHDNNDIVGIDAEVAAAIADKMGCTLEIEDIAFDSIIPEVTSGKADMGMAGMTVTEDRKQSVDFSDTYAMASQVVIVTADSAITGPADLSGKLIGVQQGTTGDIYASDEFGDESVERYAKGMEAVQALSQGKIDAVIIDGEPAKVFASEVDGLKILDEAYTTEEYAIAVKKGNAELLANLNAALAELKADGTLDSIVAKYIKAE